MLPKILFDCHCAQLPCLLLLIIASSVTLTLTSQMNVPYSREVETLLKVDHKLASRMTHTLDEFDQVDHNFGHEMIEGSLVDNWNTRNLSCLYHNCVPSNYGYNSLTSMFTSRNCTTDSDCCPWYKCNGTCCTCEKEHNGIMLCNSERYISAVLSCHCITYTTGNTWYENCSISG